MPPARRIRNPVTMDDLARRHQQIQAELARIGIALPGSLTSRTTRCQRPGCHCHASPPILHGPYPTWTRKAGARSITKTLTPQEAERLRLESRHFRGHFHYAAFGVQLSNWRS
jgi:hypothetical protein